MSCPTNNPKRPATVPTHILEVANLTFDTASPYTRPRTPYRQLERTPWLGHAPMCERSSRDRARLCDRCALHAAHHRTQVGADTTTAHKTGAKLKAQGAQELRSDLSLTTHCTTKTTILTTPGRTMAVFLDTQTYRNIGSNFNHGAGPTEAQGHGL